ncbi:MAG TPA: hypothetical protein VHN80_03950 [Kineosporiaceae bacterium]|nr:hypothetical protein [Kineosporiaceae bacterium]
MAGPVRSCSTPPSARLVIGQALTAVAYLLYASDLHDHPEPWPDGIEGGTTDTRYWLGVVDGGTP